jgi:predicted ATPase
LLTLTGPGGIGKTRLALKIAADQLGRFADGVYLADLSPITDPSLVPAAIARALMVREQPGRNIVESLADHLGDRELLLVLDNVEQVVEAASAVGRLVDAAPRLTILATSRIPLHITGEQEFPVPPLAVPDPIRTSDLETIAGNEAVTLFIDRAAAVRPDMRLTADNAPMVAEITAKLDGLPLAIELAASRSKLLAPDAILARLGTRLSLLTGDQRLLRVDRLVAYADLAMAAAIHGSRRTIRSRHWCWSGSSVAHQALGRLVDKFRGFESRTKTSPMQDLPTAGTDGPRQWPRSSSLHGRPDSSRLVGGS